jgi:hypothetical protein
MVLEWREREHEEVDVAVERDPGAQLALKICGIYKFWALKGMRAQVRLAPNAGELLGSRYRGLQPRWETIEN